MTSCRQSDSRWLSLFSRQSALFVLLAALVGDQLLQLSLRTGRPGEVVVGAGPNRPVVDPPLPSAARSPAPAVRGYANGNETTPCFDIKDTILLNLNSPKVEKALGLA